jgi:hypothetical protein
MGRINIMLSKIAKNMKIKEKLVALSCNTESQARTS